MLLSLHINDLRRPSFFFFFFNDTATTEIYTLSLHDALPIYTFERQRNTAFYLQDAIKLSPQWRVVAGRSEEHTSELQSRPHLVCRLLLEKKKERCDPLSAAEAAYPLAEPSTNSDQSRDGQLG